MSVEIRTAVDDDLEQMVAVDARNFAHTPDVDAVAVYRDMLDLDRFLLALDDGDIVGIAGAYQKELTLPGPTSISMAAVTWVSVLASHRRQGILTRLMAGMDDKAVEYEEPMLGLLASEGAIYERFGYGVATRDRSIEIDRRHAQIQQRFQPKPGSIRLVDVKDHMERVVDLYRRYAEGQPGEVTRTDAELRRRYLRPGKTRYGALHADGYAVWEVESDWPGGNPNNAVDVIDLIAATPEAHAALWHLLLSIDLAGPIRSWRAVSIDDPLPYLLDDPRALQTTSLNDSLWLKVADPVACFGTRRLRTDDGFVIRIQDEPERSADTVTLSITPDRVVMADEEPDVVMLRSAAGPLLLGGVGAANLAAGQRLTASPEVLTRLDRAFGVNPAPHTRTAF